MKTEPKKPGIRSIRLIHHVCVMIPLYVLLLVVILVLATDIEHIQNVHVMRIAMTLLLLFAAAHLMRGSIFAFGRWVLRRTTREFTPEPSFNRYAECRQLLHTGGTKRKHVVILIHGFTTSPMEWDVLAEHLRKEDIDFVAPLVFGFGQIKQDSLLSLQKEDWFRQIVDLVDLLAEQYEKISIVGHSMGGMLACYVSQVRPVHELILSAPALFPERTHWLYAWAAKSQLATSLVSWFIPMIPKPMRGNRGGPADTLDTDSSYRYFQYMAAPVRLLMALLKAQMDIHPDKIHCDRLTLLYGEHDITVNNPGTETHLEEAGLPFQRFCFAESAHNIFVDYDRDKANRLVVSLLKDQFRGPDPDQYNFKRYEAAVPKGDE
jgi:esterase/lipase/flagellar biosynthesis protein FliQ